MNRARTIAACHTAAVNDLRAWPVTTPVADVTDAAQFPELALAARHLASLTPERRAELEQPL